MNSIGVFRIWWVCGLAAVLAMGLCSVIAVQAQTTAAGSPSENLQTARQLLAGGKLEDAILVLRKLVAANPRDADAFQMLGTALALAPRQEEALEYLRRAVSLRPEYVPGHLAMGMALARFGNLEDARQTFEKALSLDPGHADAHFQLGMVLAVMGQTQSAVEEFSLAIVRLGSSPEAARAYFMRGKAQIQLEHPREAAEDLKRAVQLRPEYAKAHLELGVARSAMQDGKGALTAFQRAVELAPDDAEAQFQLGSAYLRLGDSVRAAEHLRVAARLRPEDRKTLYALVRTLQALGRKEEAAPLMEKLARSVQEQVLHDPDVVRAGDLNNVGVALEKEGKVSEALEKYRAAVAISPRHVEFRRNLALSLCRLNRWQEAAIELRAVLAAAPGDVVATKALYIAIDKQKDQP